MGTVDRRALNAPELTEHQQYETVGTPSSTVRRREPLIPAGSQVIEERIAAYRPKGVDQEAWRGVAPHVRAAVRASAPASVSQAYMTMRACAAFTLWAVAHGHQVNDREQLYRPDLVEHFAETALQGLGEHSRATYRSALRTVGRAATKRAPWSPSPRQLGRKTLSEPYTAGQIDWLRQIAADQSTVTRRRAATAVVCLAYGAGLRAPEYAAVTGAHVRVEAGVVVVDVPGTGGRTVPVVPEVGPDLLALAAAMPHRRLFSDRMSTARNWTASVVEQIEVPRGAPRFSSRRLRVTWMVRLSTAGVRVSELCDLAGLKSAHGWEDLARYVPRREPGELVALIGALK